MLPPSVRSNAFVTTTGEYAWRRTHLSAAVRALADAGLLVLGGEAWVVREGRIAGLIPLRDGQTSVFHWETEVPAALSWRQRVAEAAAQTLRIVPGLAAEQEAAPEYAVDIWYNVTFCTEEEWDELEQATVSG